METLDTSWRFLFIGGFGAVGAALALGTLAALLRYRRTGRFPGETDASARTRPTALHLVGLWLRVAVGGGLAVWAVVSLLQAGLL